jgi:hypothetical protein
LRLTDALSRIAEIRGHLARTEVFRGYRAVPVAFSGVLALVAAAVQPSIVPEPTATPDLWLAVWVGTAVIAVLPIGIEMLLRYSRTASAMERERMRGAVGRFLPSVLAGALVTLALYSVRGGLDLLPGLWAIFMSLGVFASLSCLPRPVAFVGAWYLLAGCACLVFSARFEPLAVGLTFGVGQLSGAAILWFTLERNGVGDD